MKKGAANLQKVSIPCICNYNSIKIILCVLRNQFHLSDVILLSVKAQHHVQREESIMKNSFHLMSPL